MDLLIKLNNMITAEELSKNHTRLRSATALKDLSDFAIEFAKLHVEAALNKVMEEVSIDDFTQTVNLNSILNAYPLENIK